jgi:NAD(P)-dependent dehydrogenase (short-subunit alcohol dehydrogenase family)
MPAKQTAIVTGAQQGIGAGLVEGFLRSGYNVVDAVLYLAHARQVTGEVLHVDGGAHSGRW